MCKAKTYSEQLLKLYNEIEQDYQYYSKEQSEYDKEINNLLHMLENETFNACTGYKIAKAIKNTMVNRRNVKNELETLASIREKIIQIKPEKIKERIVKLENQQIGRKYNYRQTSKSTLDIKMTYETKMDL